MGTGLEIAAIAALAGGTILQATGQIQAGNAAAKQGKAERAQAEQAAIQQQAAAQRKSIESRREAVLAASRLRALGAASGGGGGDPGLVKLESDIAGEGEYRALMNLYEGDENARVLKDQGAMAQYQGRQAKKAGQIGAASGILQSAGSMFMKYGGGTGGGSSTSLGAINDQGGWKSTPYSGNSVNWYK